MVTFEREWRAEPFGHARVTAKDLQSNAQSQAKQLAVSGLACGATQAVPCVCGTVQHHRREKHSLPSRGEPRGDEFIDTVICVGTRWWKSVECLMYVFVPATVTWSRVMGISN